MAGGRPTRPLAGGGFAEPPTEPWELVRTTGEPCAWSNTAGPAPGTFLRLLPLRAEVLTAVSVHSLQQPQGLWLLLWRGSSDRLSE